MTKIKQPANLKKWHTAFIRCVKEHGGEYDLHDHTAQYVFGFAINPEAHQLGKEYGILADAIKKEDGKVLEQHFGTPGLKEITIEDDFLPENRYPFQMCGVRINPVLLEGVLISYPDHKNKLPTPQM